MNDRLKTIVDLEKYPIQDLNSPKIKEIINKCKTDLDQFSCSTIPNFILPKSLERMNLELEKQVDKVYMSNESINPYLHSKDDSSLEKDHPKKTFYQNNFDFFGGGWSYKMQPCDTNIYFYNPKKYPTH